VFILARHTKSKKELKRTTYETAEDLKRTFVILSRKRFQQKEVRSWGANGRQKVQI
jgi:hypothetical protein